MNFIDGQFIKPSQISGEWVGRNPGDATDDLGRYQYSYAAIDEAVGSARAAGKAWRRMAITERASLLKRYQQCLRDRAPQITQALGREVGKPVWEAQLELEDILAKVDATLGEGIKQVLDLNVPEAGGGSSGITRHRPLGVMAVIGPFSSPLFYPNAHFIPALLTGNTVIFKPSEKAPLAGQIIAECMQQAGLPKGVFNLVQGEKEVGRRLCVHEGVDGVLFTGSYDVGVRIKQDTLQQHWKILVLEMGGKNPMIVWEDAVLDSAVRAALVGAFMSAGQRCTSTSRVLVHSSLINRFVEKLHQRSKAFTIGHPKDNPFMGPMIDHGSVDRYMKYLGIASREGCELVMRGKSLEIAHRGNYVTPSIAWAKDSSIEAARKSVFQQSEFFAPCIAVSAVDDVDQAIALANCTQYGLVSSVYTQNRSIYERFRDELSSGWIHWNCSTIDGSAKLPGIGLKKSGNHFPTGVFSARYCAIPVASLESENPAETRDFPGLNWKD